MRIACLHIPQFALQCATRLDPALRGAAVAVAGGATTPTRVHAAGVLHAPVVVACSRAAWAHGVRLGMTAVAARRRSDEIVIVPADPAFERETARAVGDAMLELAPLVELGGRVGAGGAHWAMYAEVPVKTRGAAFGERVVERLAEIGVTARIGIADDRFTAWVAAAHAPEPGPRGEHGEHGVTVVPRGGSAAYLAPRPLALLALSAELQHMLETLGVTTLGEFAALPAPSVERPLEADYQALARGDSGAVLRPYAPDAPVREDIAITGGNTVGLADLLSAAERTGAQELKVTAPGAIAMVARRLELRLAGRQRLAARLEAAVVTETETRELAVGLAGATADAAAIARALVRAVDAAALPASLARWRLRVTVVGEAVAGAAAAAPASIFAAAEPEHVAVPEIRHDPLAVVLSTTGSLFALAPPDLRAERRDAHRRTQRGKHRRRAPTAVQPRLFDERFEARK